MEEVDEAASCSAALVFFLAGSVYDPRDVGAAENPPPWLDLLWAAVDLAAVIW